MAIESSIEDLPYLQEGMIIRAKTRWGEQGFRLTNPEKKNTKVSVKGYHLWKDSQNYVIVDSNVVDKNCNDAFWVKDEIRHHINVYLNEKMPEFI